MHVTKDMLDVGYRSQYYFLKAVAWINRSVVRHWYFTEFLKLLLVGKNVAELDGSEIYIPTSHDPIRARIFKPLNTTDDVKLPAMLYIHGGGYIGGVPELGLTALKDWLSEVPFVVVAPDYRKAHDAPFPAAFDDCYDSLLWLKRNAASLGARDDKFVVAGHSAGGGLTAAVTLKAANTGDADIAFQMPLYPMIDDRQLTESAKDNDAPFWDSDDTRVSWEYYLRDTDVVTPYAAPARAGNYSNLPPTITLVGDLEPFRDETIAYVENLRKAGVPVEFDLYEGAIHAFDWLNNSELALRARKQTLEYIKDFASKYL